MVTRITKIEYTFLLLILFLFVISAGKYFVETTASKQVMLGLYEIQRTVTPNPSIAQAMLRNDVTYEAVLSPVNGEWQLSGKNLSSFEVLRNKQQNTIAIAGYGDLAGQDFDISVEGVGLFEGQGGVVDLDIPYTFSEQSQFITYEQEDFLPIFGYHNVLPDDQEITAPSVQIHASNFREQIRYATEEMGCNWYTFQDIVTNYILEAKKKPYNACVITFDDGFKNVYSYALPVLEEYNAVASIYVIASKVGKGGRYLNWEEIEELYRRGYEVGSHSYSSGGLLANGWSREEILFELKESKRVLEEHGFKDVTTFAYPLGEWSPEIIMLAKEVGYVAGRDTQKDNTWRDKRAVIGSYAEDFLWHMNYHRPELLTADSLNSVFSYTNFWQFEDGYRIVHDEGQEIRALTSLAPTKTSYGVVDLDSPVDTIANTFILSAPGQQFITLVIGQRGDVIVEQIAVYIDGVRTDITFNGTSSCAASGNWDFCEFTVEANLEEGIHEIAVSTLDKRILLDKFSIHRVHPVQNNFKLRVIEANVHDTSSPIKKAINALGLR